MVKLYLPYGNLRSFTGNREVTLHWFIKEREQPVAPFVQLIENYGKLTEDARCQAEQMVNEFFTEEEFAEFRAYLYTRHKEDLRTGMLVPPINGLKQDNERNRKLIRPFGANSDDETGGFCRLSEEPGYSLPFVVWGYFSRPTLHVPPMGAQDAAPLTGAPLAPR